MIVAIRFAIVAAGTVAKIYLVNQSGFLQVAQGVVNSCVTDTGQAVARSFKDLAGSRVIVSLLDHLKHRFSLGSQLWLLLDGLHDGFRLILSRGFVKQARISTDQSVSSVATEPDVDERSRRFDRRNSQTEDSGSRAARGAPAPRWYRKVDARRNMEPHDAANL